MVETITIPRSAALVMNRATRRDGESVPDPATTPSLKAAYTTIRIDPRST